VNAGTASVLERRTGSVQQSAAPDGRRRDCERPQVSAIVSRTGMRATLSRIIGPAIRSLSRELVHGSKPVFVELRPVPGAAVKDCFRVVADKVVLDGGEIVCGWRFWEMPAVFVEAEFHAVWRRPEGDLLDITPLPNEIGSYERVLFVPDPARVYEGRQVNNVRRALTQDPSVHEFFRACDDFFELMNRGTRAIQHGAITLAGAERDEWINIESRKTSALREVLTRLPQPSRNDPCPCGSVHDHQGPQDVPDAK